MVKNIKTVKQLEKYLGETLHVVSHDGYEFDATVETASSPKDPWLVLKTTNKMANKDNFWWMLGGEVCHNCAYDYQITDELNSLTVITDKKAIKKTTKYLTMAELDAARGHFCLLEDGSRGFICIKTESEERPTRVLHNYSDAIGWSYKEREMTEDDAPEAIKHDFEKAYNVWSDDDAESLKVVKILEKYDGRKYRFKKAKEESTKDVEVPVAETIETPKTILDMTIKEVLEKLDEIIKR